jgi:hypothetical protein
MSGLYTAIAAVTYTIYSGERANRMQEEQLQMQRETNQRNIQMQEKADKQAEEAVNKQNAKRPDVGAMMSAAEQSANAGDMSTMLTGAQGVKPEDLLLGRKTLLG